MLLIKCKFGDRSRQNQKEGESQGGKQTVDLKMKKPYVEDDSKKGSHLAPPKISSSKGDGSKLMADAFKGNYQKEFIPENDNINERVVGLYEEDLSEDDMLSEELLEMQANETVHKISLVKCSMIGPNKGSANVPNGGTILDDKSAKKVDEGRSKNLELNQPMDDN